MSKTASHMIPLGTRAPNFELEDVITGNMVALGLPSDHMATVIMFICNHCPYVKHINHAITQLANDYIPKKVRFLAISSNDIVNYPADSPDNMRITAQEQAYPFPYLYDETQEVALAYNAACTPDFYVFDHTLSLIYRGQLDDSRPGNHLPVTADSIREALESLLNNTPVSKDQKPSLGCNIKWRL